MSERDYESEIWVLNWRLMHGIYGWRVGVQWFMKEMRMGPLLKGAGVVRIDGCIA